MIRNGPRSPMSLLAVHWSVGPRVVESVPTPLDITDQRDHRMPLMFRYFERYDLVKLHGLRARDRQKPPGRIYRFRVWSKGREKTLEVLW